MMPFLASSVTVHKADGSVVTINGDEADESSGNTSSHPGAASSGNAKHYGTHNDTGEVVPIVAIVFVFLWLIVKALMAPFTQQRNGKRGQVPGSAAVSGGLTEEEQAILEKLQRTIGQMERRVESLETILIDEHRTKENYGSKL